MDDLRTKDAGAQLRALQEKVETLTGERTRNPGKAAVTRDELEKMVERIVARSKSSESDIEEKIKAAVDAMPQQLTLEQATDPNDEGFEDFGLVSGELLAAAVDEFTPDGPFGPAPTWVNFTTAQRAQGTIYQNTTGHHIQLSYSGSAGGSRIGLVWGPSNIGPISDSWPFKAEIGGQGRISFCQIIPPGWFYAHDISGDQYLHEFRS